MFLFPLICSCLIFSISNAQSSYPPNNLTASERGTLVDNKIIFFDSADFQLTHAFSLDLSVSWNISAPAFTNLEDLRAPTFRYTAFSAFKRDSRTLIYAFGGLNPSKDDDWSQGTFIDDFYEIDITSHPILISKLPITSEGTPGARCFFTSVFDDKGKLYIWGGETRATTDKAMYIFDTSKSKWSRVFPSSAPEQRSGYSVTFKDNKLYFIGGIFANKPDQKCVDIREILIYDTLDTNNPWTTQSATNNTYISDRYVHSAILAPDKQAIILYGGSLSGYSGVPRDYLLALDLQTFKFSVPVTQNEPKIDDVSDHPTA
ncbi:11259_t:CDS:2, partial [Ambispora gerdemannii]